MHGMRVLVAPDSFGGTLSAVEAAEAIAAGWQSVAPGDEIDLAPMSDGGPGFVDVIAASLDGRLVRVEEVGGRRGRPFSSWARPRTSSPRRPAGCT
jgi:glycerate 2-kinase